MVSDIGKLAVLLVALVGGLVLLILGLVLHDQTMVPIGSSITMTVVGYVTGNGVLARRGQAPSPVIVPSNDKVRRTLLRRAAELDAEDAEAENVEHLDALTRGDIL